MRGMQNNWHRAVTKAKTFFYGTRGEPFIYASTTLRFVPGSRPVRSKYRNSSNAVVRYDALQHDFFETHIAPGTTCLDVGGHHGQCALMMSALAGPEGKVVTFEPDPEARAILEKNLQLNPALGPITVVSSAVSDRDGTAVFYHEGGNSNSSLRPVGSVSDGIQTHVNTVTLDGWVSKHLNTRPALVKMDIEGAEISALRGAQQLLESDSIFIVELHPYAWEAFGESEEALVGLISNTGRAIRYLDDAHHHEGQLKYGSVLLETTR